MWSGRADHKVLSRFYKRGVRKTEAPAMCTSTPAASALHGGVGGQWPLEQMFDTGPRRHCILRCTDCDGIAAFAKCIAKCTDGVIDAVSSETP
jgi:hypothetical protein